MKKQSSFAVLQYRDLRLFLIGLLISSIGTQMQIVAISWHLYQLTHSAVSLGLMGVFAFIPYILFGLFSGVVADTFHRKKILLLTQFLLTLSCACLWLLTTAHLIQPIFIYFILFFNASVMSFDTPTRSATVPSMVPKEELKGAVNLLLLVRQTSLVLGPMIVGFLIAIYGPESAYFLNGLSYILFFFIILFVKISHTPLDKKGFIDLKAVKEGVVFLKNTSLISSTMFLDFFVSFFGSATVLLPVFAKELLHVNVQQLGILYAAPAFGSILTGIIVSSLKKMQRPGLILLLAMIFFGLATVGFGISRWFGLSLVFLAIIGASDTLSTMIRNVLRQSLTPDEMRGRMGSIVMIFFTGGPFLGDAEAGIAAGFIGPVWSVITGGIAATLTTIWVWKRFPQLARYKEN